MKQHFVTGSRGGACPSQTKNPRVKVEALKRERRWDVFLLLQVGFFDIFCETVFFVAVIFSVLDCLFTAKFESLRRFSKECEQKN